MVGGGNSPVVIYIKTGFMKNIGSVDNTNITYFLYNFNFEKILKKQKVNSWCQASQN